MKRSFNEANIQANSIGSMLQTFVRNKVLENETVN